LHFVVGELLKQDAGIGRLSFELASVKVAANLSLDSITSAITELEKGLVAVQEEGLKASVLSEGAFREDDRFADVMAEFSDKAEEEVRRLRFIGLRTRLVPVCEGRIPG
jgi:hypothetical protein